MQSFVDWLVKALWSAVLVLVVTYPLACNRLSVDISKQHSYDGQSGLGVLVFSFCIALLCAVATFLMFMLFWLVRAYVRKIDSLE